jgi:hypothetical protein
LPVDTGNTNAIVADSPDSSGHVRRVRFGNYVSGIVPKVITVYVAADAANRTRTRIGPDVGLQVRMDPINSFVNYRDNYVSVADGCIPGLRRAD